LGKFNNAVPGKTGTAALLPLTSRREYVNFIHTRVRIRAPDEIKKGDGYGDEET
jgi:hypothetical protein